MHLRRFKEHRNLNKRKATASKNVFHLILLSDRLCILDEIKKWCISGGMLAGQK
jgi:hypothetical protein